MKYVSFLLLGILLIGCSVLLKHEEDIEEIVEEIINNELSKDF